MPDLEQRLGEITQPALVVVGTGDVDYIVRSAEMLAAALPHARVATIPGAGHVPSLEQPDAFDALVLPFLEEGHRLGRGAVPDDDPILRDAHDRRPRDRRRGDTALPAALRPAEAQSEVLDEARLPDQKPRDDESGATQLPADVVHPPEPPTRLGEDVLAIELAESHLGSRDPFHERAPALVAAPEAQLPGGALQLHDRADVRDLAPRDVYRVAAEAGCDPPEHAARSPRVTADEDLPHLGAVLAERVEDEVVHLAAVPSLAVDELVVEDAQTEIDPFAALIPGLRS